MIAAGEDGIAWVQYEFAQPIKVRAVTLIAPGRGIPFGHIQLADDGAGSAHGRRAARADSVPRRHDHDLRLSQIDRRFVRVL